MTYPAFPYTQEELVEARNRAVETGDYSGSVPVYLDDNGEAYVEIDEVRYAAPPAGDTISFPKA